ncbi:MAG: CHASE2 domain-containing protein [Clostridia bacterium]|nr:CHASE2 domain-containing protein [Clostridia bacterium]MDD4387128.1 CHASE2 domain-containing protein [Clostridia bacterium]
MNKIKKHIIILLILIITTIVLIKYDFLDTIDFKLQDYLYQSPKLIHKDIYVIGIDEYSINNLGEWNQWSRSGITKLVEKLNEDKENCPAVIGLDVMYFDENNNEVDTKLVDALNKVDNVVIGSQIVFEKELILDNKNSSYKNFNIKDYKEPFDKLKEKIDYGFLNIIEDNDGVIRKSLHEININDNKQHSFAYEIYKKYVSRNNLNINNNIILNKYNQWSIDFVANPGEYYNGYSVAKVLNGEIPTNIFKDKIVLVGAYTKELNDQHYTSSSKVEKMYGVEINGNIIQNLIESQTKHEVSMVYQLIIIIITITMLYMLSLKLKLKYINIIYAIYFIVYIFIAYYLYKLGYKLSLVYNLLMPIVVYIITLVEEYIVNLLTINKLKKDIKQHNKEIEHAYQFLYDSLVNITAFKSHETGEHLIRTKQYMLLLTKEYGEKYNIPEFKDEKILKEITTATTLHDIGKVGIPDAILHKPGKLTEEEFEIIKTHTTMGVQMLKDSNAKGLTDETLKYAKDIINYHHEKWNGKGYPEGLSKENIPLVARIMAVCDVYDALINKRAYKDKMSFEETEKIILSESGNSFDPKIISLFDDNKNVMRKIAISFSENENQNI